MVSLMVSAAVERAWALLDAVPDPEIPVVSIRELGILRQINEQDGLLEVVLTPTYSGCPAIEQIADDVRAALRSQGLDARITTQLAPAWTTDWITPAARAKLKAYGIAPPGAANDAVAGSATVVQFAARRPVPAAVPCPRCGSHDTTETSHFGSTACKALYRCLACREPFDHFKPY
ncbi:MAG TPA: 1,2-phenylacetyl-CoA epoxidase subunit PaaD [Ramlibacter sp.]|nr:1,2-phenylacetyl-CoA epoxidase subunit PaaD [Ramlibacter sp.]